MTLCLNRARHVKKIRKKPNIFQLLRHKKSQWNHNSYLKSPALLIWPFLVSKSRGGNSMSVRFRPPAPCMESRGLEAIFLLSPFLLVLWKGILLEMPIDALFSHTCSSRGVKILIRLKFTIHFRCGIVLLLHKIMSLQVFHNTSITASGPFLGFNLPKW